MSLAETVILDVKTNVGDTDMQFKFKKDLYPQIALLKAAYNYTDKAYLHLDSDDSYFYVNIEMKAGQDAINEKAFQNEILTQSLRHEVFKETKNIRELLMARAMASTVINEGSSGENVEEDRSEFQESEIIKDWFSDDHE